MVTCEGFTKWMLKSPKMHLATDPEDPANWVPYGKEKEKNTDHKMCSSICEWILQVKPMFMSCNLKTRHKIRHNSWFSESESWRFAYAITKVQTVTCYCLKHWQSLRKPWFAIYRWHFQDSLQIICATTKQQRSNIYLKWATIDPGE